MLKIQHKNADAPLIARVIYGRPQKNGRSIFGDLVPYDMIWRVGANEATEIEFFRDVKIDGKKLAEGKIYTVCNSIGGKMGHWFLIKKQIPGVLLDMMTKKDVLRTDVKVNTRTGCH